MTKQQMAIAACIYAFGILSHWWYQSSIESFVEAALDRASRTTASQLAQIESTTTVINNKVIETVRSEKVYSECKHTPDTMLLINEALRNGT